MSHRNSTKNHYGPLAGKRKKTKRVAKGIRHSHLSPTLKKVGSAVRVIKHVGKKRI